MAILVSRKVLSLPDNLVFTRQKLYSFFLVRLLIRTRTITIQGSRKHLCTDIRMNNCSDNVGKSPAKHHCSSSLPYLKTFETFGTVIFQGTTKYYSFQIHSVPRQLFLKLWYLYVVSHYFRERTGFSNTYWIVQ